MAKKQEFLTCRRILSIMTILSFMFQYMLRINISIAIVDMVANSTNTTILTTNRHFHWNEEEKNAILGSMFWGFFLASMPGGYVSEIYGPRIVLGVAMLSASILTLLTPLVSYLNYYCLIADRFCLGLAVGVAWPSIMPIVTKWIAPTETSKFMSHLLACNLGSALTLSTSGLLIEYFHWPSVFYVTGAIALVWSLAWFYLIYGSPEEHPRISQEEKEQVQKDVNYGTASVKPKKIPFGKILTSGPVWAIIIANTCSLFNVNTAVNHIPTYMDQVLRFNIRKNGFLSSLPFLVTYLLALLSSYLADKWRKSGRFSLITIRKIFSTLALLIPASMLVLQSVWGYDRLVAIAVFVMWQGFSGCAVGGFFSNVLDIASNYSGTITGLATSAGAFTGYLTTKLVSSLVKDEQSFTQWRWIFWILIGINLVGSMFYLIFGSGEEQHWNSTYNCQEMEVVDTERERLNNNKTFL